MCLPASPSCAPISPPTCPTDCRQSPASPDGRITSAVALVWLGCADPAESMEAAREDDPELTELREIVGVWKDTMPVGQGMTCKQMVDWSEARPMDDYGHPAGDHSLPDLRDLLAKLAGDRGTVNTVKLGNRIRKHEGRIASGHRITRAPLATNSVQWRLDKVHPKESQSG